MSDDPYKDMSPKTAEVGRLTADYSTILLDAYLSILEDAERNKQEIPPEQAASMAMSAFIGARDTVYPKQYYQRGGEKPTGGEVRQKDYMAYIGDEHVASKEQRGFYHICKRKVMAWLGNQPGTKPEDAAKIVQMFIEKEFKDYFKTEYPRIKTDTKLRKGHFMFLIDILQDTYPEAMKEEVK